MINNEELRKIAAISMLSIEDEDMVALAADLSGIIKFAEVVTKVEIDSPEKSSAPAASELRRDEVVQSLPPELVLKNAQVHSGLFFLARGKGLTR